MGSVDDAPHPAKRLKTAAAAAPPPAAAEEAPPPHPFPERSSSIQALYAAAPAPPAFYTPRVVSPYPWESPASDRAPHAPYMVPPYATPIAYYPPGAVYAPTYMAAGSLCMPADAEWRAVEAMKSMEGVMNGNLLDGHRATSGSANEDASRSYGESEDSSEVREASSEPQSKKNFNETFRDGDITQHATDTQYTTATAESSYGGMGPTVAKLPVSVPGRGVSHNPASDLNVSMDSGNAPHAGVKVRSNAANIEVGVRTTPAMVGPGLMPGHPQMLDERELKKERRKQSNRESARRSRQRKQQECEDLSTRVDKLNNDNVTLRSELEQLNKDCEDLESENASIEAELIGWFGPDILSALRANSGDSSVDNEG